MKRVFGVFLLLTIAVLYSLVSGTLNSRAAADQIAFTKNKGSDSQYLSSIKAPDLFCLPVQAESYVAAGNNFPVPPLKNPFKAFLAFVKAIENFYFHNFSQYSFYAQNLLIRVKQADLIFPFHHFG